MSLNPSFIVLGLFLLTLGGLIKYQSRPESVFGGLLLLLIGGDFVTEAQVVASFANQGVLTLILLMVCSLALEKTKLLRVLAAQIIQANYRQSWLRLFSFSALFSAFLNNTAVVSSLLAPIRANPHHAPSRLLIPLSYAAILGGTLTLIGTSTNLMVNSILVESGFPSLGFFDFTLIGSCLVVGCGLLLLLLTFLLPCHPLLTNAVSDYFIDIKVMPDAPLIGKSIQANGLRHLESLFLVELQRKNRLITPVPPSEVLQEGDRLLFSGDIKKVTLLSQFPGLHSFASESALPLDNLSEVIVRPESVLVGSTLKRIGFRALFDAAVVAVKRDGEKISGKFGNLRLRAGDSLVLAVGEEYKTRHNVNKNFYFVSGVATQHTLNLWSEKWVIAGFIAAIVCPVLGFISLFKSLCLYLGGLLLGRALTPNEILQRLPTQIWLIITAALTLSHALTNTNAFAFLNTLLLSHPENLSPFVGLCLIYCMTWLLTELVTNNAAAALVLPIALGAAQSLGIDPHGYVLAVAFAASASFISPYGYQTNLMVYNAGHYRLLDFVKIGIPISIVYAAITVTAITVLYGY